MPKDQLAELTQSQRDRLAFIELRVRFVGRSAGRTWLRGLASSPQRQLGI